MYIFFSKCIAQMYCPKYKDIDYTGNVIISGD